jgi:hypothetical protein
MKLSVVIPARDPLNMLADIWQDIRREEALVRPVLNAW